jgi:hypothetical protein
MRYLKRYNENMDSSFTKEDLEDIFAHSFDMSEDHSINDVYFNPDDIDQWAHNDFSNPHSTSHPDYCITGFDISFHHSFYDEASLVDFEKYADLLSEVKSDIERFKSMYKVSKIFFDNSTDSILRLIIRP